MSDFKITLRTDLDDSLAQEKLSKLLNDSKDKKIKLTADTTDISKDLTSVLTALKEINSMSKNLNLGAGINKNSSTSKTLSEFKALTNQYNALQKQLSKETNAKSISVLKTQLNDVGNSLNKVKSQLTSAEQSMAKAFTTTSTQKLEASLSNTFSNISSKAKTLGTQIQSAFNNPNMNMTQLTSLQTRFQGLQNLINNFDMSKMSGESLNGLVTKLSELNTKFTSLNTVANQTKLENKFNIDCTKAINQLEQLRAKYSSLGKSTSEIDSLINKTKELQNSVGSVKFGNLQNQLNNVNKEVVKMKSSMSSLGSVKNTFSQIVQSFSTLAPGFLIGSSLLSGIRNLKTEILDLDKAMTNLIKVANESDVNSVEKIKNITNNAVTIAKEVAGSVSGVIDSMAEASKMGIKGGLEAVQEVAKYSQIFANIGDMDISTSTKGIATILNAFNVDPLREYIVEVNGSKKATTELANAMDILNFADNNYSIGIDGIIEAMQNGGATMSAYGLGIKESVALVTSANEAIQDPARVGNGLKSLASNLAGLSTSAATGEIKLNKTAVALETIAGIDIFTDKSQTQVKDMNVILDEVNAKWKDLTDAEQKALSNAIAGKQQSAVFNSLMNNYDTYTSMMNEFANGDQFNSALKENEKYIDSIQGRMASLKATWVGISSTIFNSDMIKGGVSALDGFSQGISLVIGTIDKLNLGIPATIAGISLLKIAFSSFRYAESFGAGISLIGMKLASIPSAIAGIPASLSVLTGLNVTMLGLVGAIAAVSVAYVGFKKIQSYIDEQNTKSTRKWKELNTNIKEYQKEIKKANTSELNLTDKLQQYEKLAKVTNKTKEEQEEYNKVLKQLAKIDPDLVVYDENGSPVKARVGEVQDLIREYQKAQREQQKLLNKDLKEKADTSYGKYDEQSNQRDKMAFELAQEKMNLLYNLNETTGIATSKLTDDWLTQLLVGNDESTKATQQYFKNLEEYKNKEKEVIDKLTTQRESVSKDQSDWLNNLFSTNDNLENIGKKRQVALQNALKLDFSQFNSESMESLGSKMNEWFSTAEYDKIGTFNKQVDEVNKLNKAWQDGDISSKAYKSSVDGIAKTLSKLTGGKISVEEFAKMLKLPEFDVESANKTFSDIEEAQNTLKSKLADMGVTKSSKQRLELAYDIIQDDKVPQTIKDKVAEFASDGNVTDQELELLLNLIGTINDDDLNKTIDEEIDKLSEEKEVTQNIAIKYAMVVDSASDYNQYLEELLGDANLAMDIQIHMDTVNLELLKKDLDGIPTEKQVGIMVSAINSGKYSPEQLQSFIQLLPEQKQVDIITSLQKSGNMTPEEIKELINGLPPSVQKKINVTTSGADTSKKQLDGVDNSSQNKNKKVTVSQSGGAATIKTEEQVDAKAKPTMMRVTISETGGKPTLSVIKSIADWAKSRTQTITTVFKTIGSFGGGSNGGHATQSVGGFSNISDTPQESIATQDSVSPMTTGVSSLSDTPTGSAESSPSVPNRNQVSAKSVGSFGSVLTDSTASTNISTSFKNVLNMIKYGVNLFQELENRISRTGNQLDLLKVQMEDAVGTKKITYLKTQNKLYEEQAKLQKVLFDSLNNEKSSIKSDLQSQGFSFNWQGNFDNYEEQLLKLEQAYETAKNKESDYTGSNETTKKNLSKATDNANQKLEDAKKQTEKYLQLHYTDIPKAEQSWYDLKNSIKETNNEIEKLDFENKIYEQKNAVDKLNNSIELYQSYASKSNAIASRYSGVNKIKYMKEESAYLQKQIQLTKELILQQQLQQDKYIGKLREYGVAVDHSTGEVVNYNDVLNNYQNSDDLDKVKQYMDDYVDLVNSQLKASNSIEDLTASMQDLSNEVNKLELENKLFPVSTTIEELNTKIKRLQNNLSVIDVKMNNAYGKDKLNLLRSQISLYEELEYLQNQSIDAMRKEESILQEELSHNGFNFNNGEIINMQSALSMVKNSGAYDYIMDVLEQWKDLHNNEIPNAIDSIEDFRKSIKDAYKEQLDVTQDIEDKIKDIYEKQLEDKKKAIEKETDAVKKSLEEQKKAYQDMRKEVDYKNDYAEKTDSISQLEKKLENARKDTSLSNKKKIADLEKQLSDARKDLDSFVQNKIDDDVQNSFDDAINAIEESNDNKLEELENYWSDSKIAEMISQSLQMGLFEGIDGTFTNLQDAMLSFAQTSGETFGVMGNVVKEELIANLGVALDTLKNYSDIMNNLGLDKVNTTFATGTMSSRSINTGDISINISTAANVNEQDIANKVKDAINQALEGAIQGL